MGRNAGPGHIPMATKSSPVTNGAGWMPSACRAGRSASTMATTGWCSARRMAMAPMNPGAAAKRFRTARSPPTQVPVMRGRRLRIAASKSDSSLERISASRQRRWRAGEVSDARRPSIHAANDSAKAAATGKARSSPWSPAGALSPSTEGASPSDSIRSTARARLGCSSMRRTSLPIRSRLTPVRSWAMRRTAASVPGSMVRANRAANRAARNARRRSSWRRSSALPIARRMPAARSARPPT